MTRTLASLATGLLVIAGLPTTGEEGYVHIHAGIHGIGSFGAAARDWRNPVARITVRRIP